MGGGRRRARARLAMGRRGRVGGERGEGEPRGRSEDAPRPQPLPPPPPKPSSGSRDKRVGGEVGSARRPHRESRPCRCAPLPPAQAPSPGCGRPGALGCPPTPPSRAEPSLPRHVWPGDSGGPQWRQPSSSPAPCLTRRQRFGDKDDGNRDRPDPRTHPTKTIPLRRGEAR